MNENAAQEGPPPRSAVPGTIVFERMAARLRQSARDHRRWAVLLLLAGVVLFAWGLWVEQLAPTAAGATAAAMAPLALAWAAELDERAQGLSVLAEDWADPGPPEQAPRRRAGLIDLVERLYASQGSG